LEFFLETYILSFLFQGAEDIKAHPFFAGMDWKKLLQKELEPPFKPHLVGALDLTYFDPACTEVPPEVPSSPRMDSFDEVKNCNFPTKKNH
jgi:hypothetical protein